MEDLDNLLKILEKSEEEVKKPSLDTTPSNIRKFVNQLKIEEGENKYPTYLLFYIYRRLWNGSARQNKLTRQSFFKYFGKVFKAKRSKKQRFYLLNDFIEINERTLTEAKHYDQAYRKKQKTENKKSKLKKR